MMFSGSPSRLRSTAKPLIMNRNWEEARSGSSFLVPAAFVLLARFKPFEVRGKRPIALEESAGATA